MKACWPAPERNKGPILAVLRDALPPAGTVLEIASGSGQHAAFFAASLPRHRFVPSDVDADNLASIRAYQAEATTNLAPPIALDVTSTDWGVGKVDAIFCANMIHIAPWSCCEGLLTGAGRHLRPGGVLILYGPYRIGGAHTADSNAEFDRGLHARDPSWGVRDLEQVVAAARPHGLTLRECIAMPANNQCLIFDAANVQPAEQ